MDDTLTHRIRERAYEMWMSDGCREGEAEQHWLAAEREVLKSSMQAAPHQPALQKRAHRATPLKRAS